MMFEKEIIEKINRIFEDVNEDILTYEGKNLMEDGIVDSFEVIAIVNGLEEEFNIEIDAEYIDKGCFDSKEGIYGLIKTLIG